MVIVGVIAAVIIAGVLLNILLNRGKEDTDDAQIDADVVQLAPRVPGQVLAVPVRENQQVKKGDLVLQIDDRDYQAKVAQATSDLDSARAQADAADFQVSVSEATARGTYSQAQAGLLGSGHAVASARSQLDQARATLASRQSDLTLADLDFRRSRELFRARAIPAQQMDAATARQQAAQQAVNAAQAQVDAARDDLRRTEAAVAESRGRVIASRPVEADIESARRNAAVQHARVESAQAALDLATLNLAWTHVVAPNDGVVSGITAFPGTFVATGQTVAQFVPTHHYVTANFKETQVGRMRTGEDADVKVDTYGRTIHGKVESLSGGTGSRFSLFPPDNATGNFVKISQRIPVRIALNEVPDGIVLRAGQSVEVTVHLSSEKPGGSQ